MASSSESSYDNLEKCTIPINNNSSNGNSTNGTNNKKKQNYGSLRKDLPIQAQKQIVNIKHKLSKGETLQGISLKYGVSIENIKRVNKIWTNNIDFVKDHLVIPIEKDKLDNLNLNLDDESGLNSTKRNEETNKNSNANYKDYLSKIDSFLNESKEKLKNLESTTSQQAVTSNDYLNSADDFLFKSSLQRQDSERKYSYLYSNDDLLTTPDFMIKQTNGSSSANGSNIINNSISSHHSNSNQRARHAYETLQKLEKEKDDLFEL